MTADYHAGTQGEEFKPTATSNSGLVNLKRTNGGPQRVIAFADCIDNGKPGTLLTEIRT